MSRLDIPQDGIPLSQLPDFDDRYRLPKVPQAVEFLSAAGGNASDSAGSFISRFSINSEAKVLLAGKPAFIFKNMSQPSPIKTFYKPGAYLYKKTDASKKLRLSGRVDLRDDLAKTIMAREKQNAVPEDDPAILALQLKLQQERKAKESNSSIFVKDGAALPPMKGKKKVAPPKTNLSFLKNDHRKGQFNPGRTSTTTSLPVSPALRANTSRPSTPLPGVGTPALKASPAKPTPASLKADAIKTALLHLLAVRPVSQNYILKVLHCDDDEIAAVLDRYGRPMKGAASKFELSDRGYRELDIWGFRYKDADDRALAVQHGISAFDRLRIPPADPTWQSLLAPEERGRGKTLSRLHLNETPQQRVARLEKQEKMKPTPATAGTSSGSDNEQKRRLDPADAAASGRSQSQGPIKKQKLSEKEAQSKRLFSKSTTKAASSLKPNATPRQKTVTEKEAIEMVRKANAKKEGASASGTKYKSAEVVVDSDDGLSPTSTPANAQPTEKKVKSPLPSQSAAPKAAINKKPAPVKGVATPKEPTKAKEPAKAKETTKPEAAKPKEAAKAKEPVKTKEPTKTAKPTEPSKPTTSAKATPVLGAKSTNPDAVGTKKRITEAEQRCKKAAAPPSTAAPAHHRRSSSSAVAKPSPLASSPPTNASDLENEVAFGPSSKSSSSSTTPLMHSSARRTGVVGVAAPLPGAVARRLEGVASPKRKRDAEHAAQPNGTAKKARLNNKPKDVTTTNGGSQAAAAAVAGARAITNGATPNGGTPAHLTVSATTIESAQDFKKQTAKYALMRSELAAMEHPPADKVETLHRLHSKLVKHKESLWKMVSHR